MIVNNENWKLNLLESLQFNGDLIRKSIDPF